MLLLLAITAAVAFADRNRYLTVGWLWFLGTLVPMIGLEQVGTQAMADRYAYLSFIGLFLMVCWLVGDWTGDLAPRLRLIRVVAVMVLLGLAAVAHRQVDFWDDHITLWTHTLEVTTNNWIAENNSAPRYSSRAIWRRRSRISEQPMLRIRTTPTAF